MGVKVRLDGLGSFELAQGWQPSDELPSVVDGPQPKLVCYEPEHDDGHFRANLVAMVVDAGGLTFSEWQTRVDEALPVTLDNLILIDLEKLEILGLPGGRRLAHYRGPGGWPVTLEQWCVDIDGNMVTLTFSVDSLRYDELADDFAAIVASWKQESP